MNHYKGTETGGIKRHYPGSLISLVAFAKGEERLTSESSRIEGRHTQIPKKLPLGDQWVLRTITYHSTIWRPGRHMTLPERQEGLTDWLAKHSNSCQLLVSEVLLFFFQKLALLPEKPFFHPLLPHHESWLFLAMIGEHSPFLCPHFTPVLFVSLSSCYLGDEEEKDTEEPGDTGNISWSSRLKTAIMISDSTDMTTNYTQLHSVLFSFEFHFNPSNNVKDKASFGCWSVT